MDNRKSDAGHRRQTEDSYGSKFPPVTFKSLGLPKVQFSANIFDIWNIMMKNHACNKSEDRDAKKDEDPGGGRVGRQGGWWGGAQDDIYWCLWTRPECSLTLASLFNSNTMTYTIHIRMYIIVCLWDDENFTLQCTGKEGSLSTLDLNHYQEILILGAAGSSCQEHFKSNAHIRQYVLKLTKACCWSFSRSCSCPAQFPLTHIRDDKPSFC